MLKIKLTSRQITELMDDCWTIEDMKKVFGVSHQTIHNWRKHMALPVIVIPGDDRPSVRYLPEEVRAWVGETHGIAMVLPNYERNPQPAPTANRLHKGWTAREDARLIREASRGKSAAEIAARWFPSKTRDAVWGRGWRLGYFGNSGGTA